VHSDPNEERSVLFTLGPIDFSWRGLFWGVAGGLGLNVLNTELWRGGVNPDHVALHGSAKAELLAKGPPIPAKATLAQYVTNIAQRQMSGARMPLVFVGLGILACNAHYTSTASISDAGQVNLQRRVYRTLLDRHVPQDAAYDTAFRTRY